MTQKTVFLGTVGAVSGALAVVQKKVNGGSSTVAANSVAATFTSATAAGNLIVAVVNGSANTTTSVTDSAGNTYVQAGSNQTNAANNINFWYAKNALANAGTVTAHFSGSATYVNIVVYEVSGADPVNPFVSQQGVTSSTNSATMSTGTLSVAAPSQQIIFAGGSTGIPPASGGTGYTFDNFGASGDAHLWQFSEYHVVTAAEAATATQSGSSVYIISAAVFRANNALSTTLPADFGAPWKIIAIGAGSGGAKFANSNQASSGGAGGAFSQITNADATATAGQTIFYSVGAGTTGGASLNSIPPAGDDTWLNLASNAAPTLVSQGVLAKGGGAPGLPTGGTGGQASAGVGSTKHNGGNGGLGDSSSGNIAGGAGGGAAGAQGDGGAGAPFGAVNVGGGSGGGGSGGGGSGTVGGAGSNSGSTAGGAGGNNAAGVGAGPGGSSPTGHDGTLGGGGGGPPPGGDAGAGGLGADYTQTSDGSLAGPGGGGASAAATSGTSRNSAGGGLYGAGGAGATAGASHGGDGAQGIIILIYTPAAGQPATGMTDLRIPQRPATLTFDQSPYNLTLYTVAARPFIPSDTAQPVRLRISIPGATWPNLVLGATSAAASPFIPYASAQLVRLRLLLPEATWPNLVLQQGPAPQGGPFPTADTAQMVRFVRWAPREFTVYNPALIVPQPVLLSIVEAANARDFIDVTTTFNASLIEAVSASDRIDAVLVRARKAPGITVLVLDPRPMEIQHWSRMVSESLLQLGYVPTYTDEENWQMWAACVKNLPVIAGTQVPDPRAFGRNWRGWVFRLNEALLSLR